MTNLSNIRDVGTVRLKAIESCNWTCSFCHNEGDIHAKRLEWDSALETALKRLRDEMGVGEVHLTGGEPSLNKSLPSIVEGCAKLGLRAKMTTNGQFSEPYAQQLVDAGIEAVNFSVQSLSPDMLNAIMLKQKGTKWALEEIEKTKRNMIFLRQADVKVRANCVLSGTEDVPRVDEVLRWILENDIEMRILDDLHNKEQAAVGIQQLIDTNAARLVNVIHTPGTSSSRYVYETSEGKSFIVKQIEKVFLDQICGNCPERKNGTCQEGFYNIRMQRDRFMDDFLIVLCIQEQNKDTVMPLQKFLELNEGGHYDKI